LEVQTTRQDGLQLQHWPKGGEEVRPGGVQEGPRRGHPEGDPQGTGEEEETSDLREEGKGKERWFKLLVCCGTQETSESEEAQSINESGLSRRQVASEQSRHDRVVQETQEKTLVIINASDYQTRSCSLAGTKPKQIQMQDVQFQEFQCSAHVSSFGQLEAFPIRGVREGVPQRLEDLGSVVPPDIQII
jgi:hypothetical protein